MSIQWTIAATFLYAEIIVVLLLVLPVVSPKGWQGFFRSRFLNALRRQAQFYFFLILLVLTILLLDAIREMRKYSGADSSDKGHTKVHQLDLEMQANLRLFRAQRNFYISGFALFNSFVIRRLVTLISSLAAAQAQGEAALKQAAGASSVASKLMGSKDITGKGAQNTSNEAYDEEVSKLKLEISKLKSELEHQNREYDVLKKQAEANFQEYDRVCEEHQKLEKKLAMQSGDKKDD